MEFTIGIPVRNGEQYLGDAVESALGQSRMANEVLIIDDDSTDGTRDLCLSSKWASRIRYVRNSHATGFADAFNRVGQLARSRFVVLLSADDVLDRNFLLLVESALSRHPTASFCYTGCQYVDSTGVPLQPLADAASEEPILIPGHEYSRRYLAGVATGQHIHRCAGITIDRRFFVEQCNFRTDAGLIADADFFYRLGAKTDVVGIPAALAKVRIHSASLTNQLSSLNYQLSKDYVFQLRSFGADRGSFSTADLHTIAGIGNRVLSGFVGEALRSGEPAMLAEAIRLDQEFEQVKPAGYLTSRTLRQSLARWAAAALVSSAKFMSAYQTAVPPMRSLTRRWRMRSWRLGGVS